jgi:hypothetical protein
MWSAARHPLAWSETWLNGVSRADGNANLQKNQRGQKQFIGK